MSDVAQLPLLNQFVFTTLFAFKYRKNCYDLEQQLYKKLFVNPDVAETAEDAKRNRIIQIADLINQAKARAYLTEEEANNVRTVDEVKLRQVLARTTNELLASITVPMRRAKRDADDDFFAKLGEIEDEEQKKELQAKHKEE